MSGRDVEQIFPVLDEPGIGFVAYSQFGCGRSPALIWLI
jgi:hypothetical protein